MIDSHCHLADEAFAGDLEGVVSRARAAGVERALVILAAGDHSEADRACVLERLWPEVRVAIGVHPHQAGSFSGCPGRAADVVREQIAATPSTRAVGEIGLDYHYDFASPEVQRSIFREQVRLARQLNLPVVIHTREADADTLAILREEGGGEIRGVLHCFTGGPDLARSGLDLGLYISLAGIVTFPKAGGLRDTVRTVPVDRLLTETDSPFLAPVPYRGRRNEPGYVPLVLDAVAAVHGIDREEMAEQTRRNFHRLFRA